MRRRRRLVLALCLASLFVSGCDREDVSKSAASPRKTSALPSIVEGQPCPPAPGDFSVSGAGCVSSASGTFESGSPGETFSVYALLGDDGFPASWHAQVTRGEGAPLEASLDSGSPASYPVVLGAEDADGKGLDEVFIRLVTHSYHSGKTHEVGMFGVDDGRLFRVEADSEPLLFQVGGVSVFGQGAECRDVDVDGDLEFVLLGIDGVVGYDQSWVERIYSWKDRALVLSERREGRSAKAGYTDPLLWRFYSLRCLEFDPGPPYTRG